MLGRKELNTAPTTLAHVKKILGDRSADPDFGYEQQTCLDYANSFCKLGEEDARQLVESLATVEGLMPDAAIKIADILPSCKSTVLAIIAKDKVSLDDAAISSILELVKKASEKRIEPPPKAADKKEGEESEGSAAENTSD
ncbi:MAG: RNA polymerase Rpb4 family protein [Candidatus Micrarchaeota archaeon]